MNQATHFITPDGDLIRIPPVSNIWVKDIPEVRRLFRRKTPAEYIVRLDTDYGPDWSWRFNTRVEADYCRDLLISSLTEDAPKPTAP